MSRYLTKDATIQGKLQRLQREGRKLEASRRHLFIGMASTGKRDFIPPEILDDLRLEGGTGELYHWTREDGWVFHDLQK